MFGFAPKLPISEVDRQWVDASFDRLVDLFGRSRLDAPVVLPTPEFFPVDWEATDAWIGDAFSRVCALMGVDRARVELELFEVEDPTDDLRESLPYWRGSGPKAPAGLYREHGVEDDSPARATIAVDRAKVVDPVALIATVSHELAHLLLLGDRKIDRDVDDMEPLTDLMTVYCGFGIFTANSAFRFRQWSSDGGKAGWSTSRLGYLSEPIYGYALARYARLRGETKPAWAKHLSLNVRTYMSQSMRFLAKKSA